MIEVIDSYLPGHEWKDLYERVFTVFDNQLIETKLSLPWYYSPDIAEDGDKTTSTGYFVHKLLDSEKYKSEHYEIWMDKLFDRLDLDEYKTLFRAKINFYPRTTKLESHGFHIDIGNKDGSSIDHMNAVYYLNDCNGFTEFEDGSRIASKANRIVIFHGDMKHRSTSCTDAPARVSINMNILP